MFAIINGLRYDTRKAKWIAKDDVKDLVLYKTKNGRYFQTYKKDYWIDYTISNTYPDYGWTEILEPLTEAEAFSIFCSCAVQRKWFLWQIFPNEYYNSKEA